MAALTLLVLLCLSEGHRDISKRGTFLIPDVQIVIFYRVVLCLRQLQNLPPQDLERILSNPILYIYTVNILSTKEWYCGFRWLHFWIKFPIDESLYYNADYNASPNHGRSREESRLQLIAKSYRT